MFETKVMALWAHSFVGYCKNYCGMFKHWCLQHITHCVSVTAEIVAFAIVSFFLENCIKSYFGCEEFMRWFVYLGIRHCEKIEIDTFLFWQSHVMKFFGIFSIFVRKWFMFVSSLFLNCKYLLMFILLAIVKSLKANFTMKICIYGTLKKMYIEWRKSNTENLYVWFLKKLDLTNV